MTIPQNLNGLRKYRPYIPSSWPKLSLKERQYYINLIVLASEVVWNRGSGVEMISDFFKDLKSKELQVNTSILGDVPKLNLIDDLTDPEITRIESLRIPGGILRFRIYGAPSADCLYFQDIYIEENLISEDYVNQKIQEYYDKVVMTPEFKGFIE